jgi:hypothetical protein
MVWTERSGRPTLLRQRSLKGSSTETAVKSHKKGDVMAKKELFIERRTQEGDYAIRKPGSTKASDVCDTQAEAIERAGEINPNAAILVERVRNTNRGSRDKWRKP